MWISRRSKESDKGKGLTNPSDVNFSTGKDIHASPSDNQSSIVSRRGLAVFSCDFFPLRQEGYITSKFSRSKVFPSPLSLSPSVNFIFFFFTESPWAITFTLASHFHDVSMNNYGKSSFATLTVAWYEVSLSLFLIVLIKSLMNNVSDARKRRKMCIRARIIDRLNNSHLSETFSSRARLSRFHADQVRLVCRSTARYLDPLARLFHLVHTASCV